MSCNHMIISKIDNKPYINNGQFTNHLKKNNITVRDYYIKYEYKENPIPSCMYCESEVEVYGYFPLRVKKLCSSKECKSKCTKENRSKINQKSSSDKRKKTCKEKYGKENVFQVEEIKDKIKDTLLTKYGESHNLKINEVREKSKLTCKEKYGNEFFTKTEEYKIKTINTCLDKYGENHQAHINYSDELKNILFNKEIFNNIIINHGINYISKKYNISEGTVYQYCKKYNISCHQSIIETNFENFLKEYNLCYISNCRTLISPKEIDFYLPEYNIAIEINGLYWHSDMKVSNNYHLDKYNLCKEKNIRLISINEDEWIERKELIKSKILNLIGKSEKGLPARKLIINKISNSKANEFCDKFHIQGKTGQITYACGAFDDDVLIGVMLFNKQRNTQDIELIRFCTDGKIHNGLFSKLLKFSIKENNYTKIISFADLRYSEGNLYEKTGFIKLYQTKPDYMYCKNSKSFHKSNFSKSSLKKKKLFDNEYINNHTEKELTEELGYYRIYDIGKIKYEMLIK